MTNINNLKIYIVEYNSNSALIFKEAFKEYKNVTVINDDLMHFFQLHQEEIDCLVSPANSYGHMAGGFDARLSDILGWDFQEKVQQYIKEHFNGCQPVATSFMIKTHLPHLSLIHTPTMKYPSPIEDDQIISKCTTATLLCALKNNIKCIILPVFGGSCGGLSPEVTSQRMKESYIALLHK
ncbi:MAG: macro domain-containing protein [Bacilli bacterium]|nr:macro domain-containing protein [Bacilli bacterium]